MTRRPLALLTPVLLGGCMMSGPSKVGQGQLYAPGTAAYDDYFRNVHQYQVDAAGWGDDKKSAHHALVTKLDLAADAPDVTIVQAAHEAASRDAKQAGSVRLEIDGTNARVVATGGATGGDPFFRAVEDASHQELDRAKHLHAIDPKLDALTQQGNDLTTRAHGDWASRGEAKQREVETELAASLDALSDLKKRAGREARESEDFVADLERALETASEDRAAKQREKRHKREKAPKSDTSNDTATASAPKRAPAPAPAAASEPAPKPAPAPKAADTSGEVFTP